MMFTEHKAVRVRGVQIQIEQARIRRNCCWENSSNKQSAPRRATEVLFIGGGGQVSGSLGVSSNGPGSQGGVFDQPGLLQGRSLISSLENPGEIRFTVIARVERWLMLCRGRGQPQGSLL